jgi:hypothetical protein
MMGTMTRAAREDNSRDAVFRSFFVEEIRKRLVPDIKGECQEADANQTQAEHLIPFALQHFSVN